MLLFEFLITASVFLSLQNNFKFFDVMHYKIPTGIICETYMLYFVFYFIKLSCRNTLCSYFPSFMVLTTIKYLHFSLCNIYSSYTDYYCYALLKNNFNLFLYMSIRMYISHVFLIRSDLNVQPVVT